MSLYLGKVHFFMYDKILWFEGIEEEIIKWAEVKGLPVDKWRSKIIAEFGEPTGGKPLEEVIDTSNIHGWLQERIKSAELRQAALVTTILKENPDYKSELVEIFAKLGEKTAREYGESNLTPEEIYGALNNFILEGMPCDRVEQLLVSEPDEYAWKLTRCLHKQYWDKTAGNVENFYDLRGAWIKSFVETMNSEFSYERSEENIHRIFSR